MTLSDLIVGYLEQFGVEYVFSVPGGPLGALYDALVRSQRRGGPRSILTRHENGSAFMADGYARETGKIGVCCSTTGPGATNLITGVAEAYADHIPLLVITTQTALPDFGRGCFQESSADVTDIMGMFDHCTCYNSLVSHPDQLENKLVAAFTAAFNPPKGPAHLSIPVDILRLASNKPVSFPNLHNLLAEPSATVDSLALDKLGQDLTDVLRQNRNVVILAGHGCGGAAQQLIEFAEHTGANIVSTQRGKSWVNPYHPQYLGVFGFSGHKTARQALADKSVDLILAIGTDLNEWATGGWDPVLMNHKLVHIHNFSSAFTRSPMARMHICGTIRTIFEGLVLRIKTAKQEGKLPASLSGSSQIYNKNISYPPPQIKIMATESCRKEKTDSLIKPQRVFREIIERFPHNTRFLIDNSNSVPWSIHYFFHPHPENYHLSIGFASMGWAIGASVGVALGAPDRPVVCFTGDGCFLMSGQEITVAVQEKLLVVFVVLNDKAYGMIKHGHRLSGSEAVDYSISAVDFCMMARAVGAQAYAIRKPEDFDKIDYKALCKQKGPTLLDIHIDPEEKPPLGMF
ncbi:MAG: thiamine pyrophosphate-binding protein [Desulfobacterales bacterium]